MIVCSQHNIQFEGMVCPVCAQMRSTQQQLQGLAYTYQGPVQSQQEMAQHMQSPQYQGQQRYEMSDLGRKLDEIYAQNKTMERIMVMLTDIQSENAVIMRCLKDLFLGKKNLDQ